MMWVWVLAGFYGHLRVIELDLRHQCCELLLLLYVDVIVSGKVFLAISWQLTSHGRSECVKAKRPSCQEL